MKRIHFLGILGTGMSSLAIYCQKKGYFITGSDLTAPSNSNIPDWLPLANYRNDFDTILIDQADIVIYSTAIKNNHKELIYSKEKNKTILHRSELIDLLASNKNVISVTGTHGKTTTSSLIAWIFSQCNKNPNFLLGGKPISIPSAQFNDGLDLILEADESDRSFLNYKTDTCVITNIEADHLEFHENSVESYLNAFYEFIKNTKVCVYNAHDANTKRIVDTLNETITCYAFGHDDTADFKITDISHENLQQLITIQLPNAQKIQIKSSLLGKYNAENIVAAWIISYLHNIDIESINQAIELFHGVERRCQHIGNIKHGASNIPIIDDYGHHPTESQSVLTEYKRQNKKTIFIFQPHKYSRLTRFFHEFVEALSIADVILVLDVYSAGEMPLEHKNTHDLIEALKDSNESVFYVKNKEDIVAITNQFVDNNSIVLFQGAGSISMLAHDCVAIWNQN